MTGKSSRIKEPVEEKVAKPKKGKVKRGIRSKKFKINEQDKVIGNSIKLKSKTNYFKTYFKN